MLKKATSPLATHRRRMVSGRKVLSKPIVYHDGPVEGFEDPEERLFRVRAIPRPGNLTVVGVPVAPEHRLDPYSGQDDARVAPCER
jgi:hypothetical protein